MAKNIGGIIPPLLTPFDNEGKVHEFKLRNLIQFLSDKVHGLFICGTYGSGPAMSLKDRKRVVEIAVDQLNGKLPVIVHVGATSLDDVIDLSLHAKESGAQAVAAVPPFYYKYSQDEIIRFFERLVSKVDIPVFLYNNPNTSGLMIEIETVQKLKDIGLIGIKDSTFDLSYFYRVKNEVGIDDFTYISGSETFIIPTIPLGARGVISGLANAFPEVVVELYNSVKNKEFEKAFLLQGKINALRQVIRLTKSILSVHIMLKLRGIDSGVPKFPMSLEGTESIEEKMRNEMIKLGFENYLA